MKFSLLLAASALFGLWATCGAAHPLGNNTVNRQAAITVEGNAVRIDYRLDLAEIPTLLASQAADVDGDGSNRGAEWQAHAEAWAATLTTALEVSADAHRIPLRLASIDWQLVDGAAGLEQLRLHAVLQAAVTTLGRVTLRYADRSRPDDIGWREVWVTPASGARLIESSAAPTDRSAALTHFPALGGALLNETSARIVAELDGLGGSTPSAESVSPPVVATPRADGLRALFLLGVHHIATGLDHLVFLLGLVLLCRSLRALLAVVTAFTAAHSLSLGLAAAHLVTPPGALIEPSIALSIAYIGLCNVYQRQRAHGVALAFGFGLIHGFGFAGALAETLGPQALDGHGWLLSLAAFNLGIESFQVALLCVAVPLMGWAAQRTWAASAQRGASHAVLWAGLGWFALRVSGT